MNGAHAQEASGEASGQSRPSHAEQQARLDAADDETRESLAELRRLEGNARRLSAYNDELERMVRHQADLLERRKTTLAAESVTDETLPPLLRDMVNRLDTWVAGDMPFLREERQARVASLEQMLVNPELDKAERLDRILSAWRAELEYGRELDAWRGMLDENREVDFLRLGRVGLYYLTPDGRQGGVWRDTQAEWQPLGEDARRDVQRGLRIAQEQRAPELLTLPVSQPLTDADGDEESP